MSEYCVHAGWGKCPYKKRKQTNADKIRSMTDEELVDFIDSEAPSCTGLCDDFAQGCYNTCKHNGGRDVIREWLQAEAE